MAKFDVAGEPYRVKVLAPATCMKCGKLIRRGGPAYGVRRGLSFFYYHIKHKPKDKD